MAAGTQLQQIKSVNTPDIRGDLRKYHFKQGFAIRYLPWIIIAVVAAGSLALVLFGQSWLSRLSITGVTGTQLATALIAFAGLGLGYQQWRAARHEISLDKYYERLNLANQRLNDWTAARALYYRNEILQPEAEQDAQKAEHERFMYVCVELDNLEYAVQKYRNGFMSAELAHRALQTFRERCAQSEFRRYVKNRLVSDKYPDYTEETFGIAKQVCEEFGDRWPKTGADKRR
ncbi:MAG: hypothetical protein M3Q65_25150 [Chloroflexota bacterium]|nr:hypothetical protein [Chloroflexota bacterium]